MPGLLFFVSLRLTAGVAHAVSLTFVTKSTQLEAIGVVALTYILTLDEAIPFGFALLTIIGLLKIGLVVSLGLFLVTAPLAVIAVSTVLFGSEPKTIPLQYAFVAAAFVLAAWYASAYHTWKCNRINTYT